MIKNLLDFRRTDIVIFDTETTGLLKPIPTNIERQPFLTEIYGIRLNKDLEFVSEFETFVKPPISIPPEIVKATNIDDSMVENAPKFIEIYEDLFEFFFNLDNVVAHNLMFDIGMLKNELFRHDLDFKFNWPKNQICTVEKSYKYKNKRLKLAYLHEYLFGKGFKDAHRAKNDVNALTRCFIEMVKRGDITI